MPRPKKNKTHIKPNDGRKHNKGTQSDKRVRKAPKLTPAKLNKAKRARMELYAINAIREKFGSEEAVFEFIAEQAANGKQYYMTKLLDYAYGDPRDIDRAELKEENKTPKIVFINNKQDDKTIEIDHEEDSDNGEGEEDGDPSEYLSEQEEVSSSDTEEE